MPLRRVALAAFLLAAAATTASLPAQTLELHSSWRVQSSATVPASGAAISQPGFADGAWYAATVPTTVFNTLVANHVVADPDYGMNLRAAPGVSYKPGANFSHEEMAADSPYRVPWWYRTEFTLPPQWRGRTVWLDFRGINYRADIWVNGRQIASNREARGTFRRFEFDISAAARAGRNALAVEVYAPGVHDLAITFVDWNPMPPDKDMGLWGKVVLSASGPVAIRDPFVATALDSPHNSEARLTVSTTLVNASDAPQSGTLLGRIGAIAFQREVQLAPRERKLVTWRPDDTPALRIPHPALWWPYQLGAPRMQALELEFRQGADVSDRARLDFGISQITAARTPQGAVQFIVNGRPVLIRGGGYAPDMMLRDGPDRWAEDFRYVRALNLNAVRLEGKLMDDAFFDLADRNGILVLAGWCCCDHWEEWSGWSDGERAVATASLHDQAQRLRTHPSLLAWLNGSDNPPPAAIERAYLDVLRALDWPKPILSSASGTSTTVTGASGVKMTGPYDYVPPVYWLEETKAGGALGFNTETSPGAAIPPLESLRRFLPANHLWPIDGYWNYHAGSGQFATLDRYNAALAARYGAPRDLDDYIWKAQAMSYEGERAMFESFGRNQGEATGVIQWMLNNGWPSLIWHLYDFYLRPGAGFYGARIANEPVHVEYSDFDHQVTVVNTLDAALPATTVTATEYDLAGHALARRSAQIAAAAHASRAALDFPPPAGWNGAYFLRLELAGYDSNFYWLSTRPDILDAKAGTWFYMPETSYADFTALQGLPAAAVAAQAAWGDRAGEGFASVRVANPGPGVAFLVRLRVLRAGEEVLPVYWSDNYITLLPGETRRLTVSFPAGRGALTLAVDGWNVKRGVP